MFEFSEPESESQEPRARGDFSSGGPVGVRSELELRPAEQNGRVCVGAAG